VIPPRILITAVAVMLVADKLVFDTLARRLSAWR